MEQPEPGKVTGEEAQEAPAASPVKPKRKPLRRGRRADPNRAPPTYLCRLANDLAREAMERAEARQAANRGRPTEPLFPKQPRRMTEAEAFAVMALTPSQRCRRRTAELKKQREEKGKRDAALLDFIQERKAARAEAERRAAERKAQGVKLSFEEWREEITGCPLTAQ